MEWIEALRGSIVALDTAPLIYFIEEHPAYLPKIRPFFEAVERGEFRVRDFLHDAVGSPGPSASRRQDGLGRRVSEDPASIPRPHDGSTGRKHRRGRGESPGAAQSPHTGCHSACEGHPVGCVLLPNQRCQPCCRAGHLGADTPEPALAATDRNTALPSISPPQTRASVLVSEGIDRIEHVVPGRSRSPVIILT